jgi:hypothetical protein
MNFRAPPKRHCRSYGNNPLPTGTEALDEPFSAFPSWFLRTTCDRCDKVTLINEAHSAGWRDKTLRRILARMRHDGCGGCRKSRADPPWRVAEKVPPPRSAQPDGGLRPGETPNRDRPAARRQPTP